MPSNLRADHRHRHRPDPNDGQENFDEWSRILFTYPMAPMTLIWGVEDPVAVIAMAVRIKKNRQVTDLYKMEGTSHWPMIEDPDYIGDAIIARLDSV